MKIFYGKNRRGIWRASLNEETMSRYSNGCYSEDNIPVLHNAKVYMVEVYCGFDYTSSGIRNVMSHSRIFHSVMAAKKGSKLWKEYETEAKAHPELYFIDRVSIISNVNGEPFEYGDVMEGHISMKIIGVKVI